ncbi:MAG: hypothetical protein IAE88_11680 [Rhodobacteraceae bacterium]|nr:hypothetical protein [Paracoccaceae bacterium]
MKTILLLLGLLLLSPLATQAQVVQVKGVGTVSYSGSLSAETKEKAYVKAQVAAVERYFAENGEAESQNFEGIQDKIEASLEKFILSTNVLNEQDQESLRKYSVAVRVELNVAKLRNTLRASSAAAQSPKTSKSQLVYVFVGREAASVRSFDERVFKRRVDSADSATSQQSETGGSTTRKADAITYRLLPMTNYTSSITGAFSQAGYVIVDPAHVIGDKDFNAVNKDFSSGNDIAPETMRSVVGTLRKNHVPLLVLATLDVGAHVQDGATGMQRVAVTVTSRVLDLSNNLPREVASVPAIQYSGLGPDNQSATNKALKDASTAAAREVISRLNAAGIQ